MRETSIGGNGAKGTAVVLGLLLAWGSLLLPAAHAQAASTETVLTSTPNPSSFGQTVTLGAIVRAANGLAPTGTVSFRNGGNEFAQSALSLIGEATQVAAGGEHTCALKTDGTVACWGGNWTGQLGTGSTDRAVPTPQLVSGLTGV
jgi:hypothetical protein